ncbi:MAG: type VI secretion system tube protein Hcp [Rhodospirillales bacterium]|nr:type VI secretion system tube protein Hcp [Rhodospirillales bacterium]
MAFDAYMFFKDAGGTPLSGESQVAWSDQTPLGSDIPKNGSNVFEIDDFNFDIEQVLNIGSQSSGIGAGRVTFNPFTITRKTDKASVQFFTMCCAGTHFKEVSLLLRKAGAGGASIQNASGDDMASGATFLRYDFGLVGVKTISWSGSDGDEAPKEEIAFEYGSIKVRYCQQNKDGSLAAPIPGSWNRINNTSKFDIT